MKFNREEIIKALECCSDCDCYNAKMQEDCPLINVPFCKNYLRKQSLVLIKELTEENEFHRKTISENAQMALEVTIDEIEKAKSDTVRKMQEKLKDKLYSQGLGTGEISYAIDHVAKEILEE